MARDDQPKPSKALSGLWWLSFAGDSFLGAAIIPAADFISAVTAAHLLGINPGGEVLGHPWIGEEGKPLIPDNYIGRLLNTRELDKLMEIVGSQKAGSSELNEFIDNHGCEIGNIVIEEDA
jgi:hypothetical protein